jgi:hypothetical protein
MASEDWDIGLISVLSSLDSSQVLAVDSLPCSRCPHMPRIHIQSFVSVCEQYVKTSPRLLGDENNSQTLEQQRHA